MQTRGWRARIGQLAAALAVAACSSTTATPTPAPTSTTAPAVSTSAPASTDTDAGPTATPSAVATQSLAPPTTAPPSPTPGEPSPLVIKWVNPPGASGLGDLHDLRWSARQGNRFVIVGAHNVTVDGEADFQAAIWWSDDATTWHAATLPAGYGNGGCCISDVAAGGPGFVAVGGGKPLWSTDGETWSEATANGLSASSSLITVGASATGLIALGYDDSDKSIAFESADGKVWSGDAATAQLLGTSDVLFANGGGNLLAFAIHPTAKNGQTTVWQMAGIDVWRELTMISGAVQAAAYGPKGWLAVSDGAAWLSPHGVNWTQAPTGPKGYADAALSDSAGFVVASEILPPGCAIDESQIVGQTWTSVDGLDWTKMKQQWTGRWLNALFDLGSTVVGVGQAHQDGEFGYVRTADLPPTGRPATPTAVPTPTPNPGC